MLLSSVTEAHFCNTDGIKVTLSEGILLTSFKEKSNLHYIVIIEITAKV